MGTLTGTPSDEVAAILATGRADVETIFVSMSARHPDGRDAEYIEWHGIDHEPEQRRLAALRASLRLVSTPACRRARAWEDDRYHRIDHVMTYLFTDVGALEGFNVLNRALTDANRNPYRNGRPFDSPIPGMPLVEMSAYGVDGMVAAPRVKVGADVLPWWPARGVLLLVERGRRTASELTTVDGVAGAWWGTGLGLALPYGNADNTGLQITYCFLDADPAETGVLLRQKLETRWSDGEVVPLLAAPFHAVVRYDWARYLP